MRYSISYFISKYILGFKNGFDMSNPLDVEQSKHTLEGYKLIDKINGLHCYTCGKNHEYSEYPEFFTARTVYCKACGSSMATASNLEKWCKWKDKQFKDGKDE